MTGWNTSELRRHCQVYNRKITRRLLKMHLRLSSLYRKPELSPAGVGLPATTLQEQPCLLSKLERPDSDCRGGN